MGNTSKKLAEKCTILTREEQKNVAATFRAASRNSNKIREEDLIKLWGPQIDPRLAQYLSNFLFGYGPNKTTSCNFDRFAELYVFNVRGCHDERMSVLYDSLGMEKETEIPYQLLKEYCESIASTYIKLVKTGGAARWVAKGFRGRAAQLQALAEGALPAGSRDAAPGVATPKELASWLMSDTLLKHLSEVVFINLYGVNRRPDDDSPPALVERSLLPAPDGLDAMPDYPAFIDLSHIVWLNNHLPMKHQHKWRFLFSSHIHGESFATMAGRIVDQGPSLMIIEDTNGYIFGGYAAEAWAPKPSFYGNDQSFLFTLAPKMRVYPASGYNDHFQYFNQYTKTLPNGLLMGGQLSFGGIWLESDPFGRGSSAESCSTFRHYRRLSKEEAFTVASIEVWGVGDKPVLDKDEDERDTSILDGNTEAKAILEMAGKTRHSEGLREPKST